MITSYFLSSLTVKFFRLCICTMVDEGLESTVRVRLNLCHPLHQGNRWDED